MIPCSRTLLTSSNRARVTASSLTLTPTTPTPATPAIFSRQSFSTSSFASSPLRKQQCPSAPTSFSSVSPSPFPSSFAVRFLSTHEQSMEKILGTACAKTNSILPSHEWVAGEGDTEDGPVVVILHGILGSRRNWKSFAKLYLQLNPTHRILLVDLRNHGSSSLPSPLSLSSPSPFPITHHRVADLARDIVRLEEEVGGVAGFDVMVGHSFGGKVAYSYSQLREKTSSQQVWALDTWLEDHFEDTKRNEEAVDSILEFIKNNPRFETRKDMTTTFSEKTGLSKPLGQWLATSLAWADDDDPKQGMRWVYNIENISDMYESYKVTDVWDNVVNSPPPNTHFHLVRAGKSTRWTPPVIEKLEKWSQNPKHNFNVHVMENSGHWVHVDDPQDLLSILHSETMYL